MENGSKLSLQDQINIHSNAVHRIRTNMNSLTPVGLSGYLRKDKQLGYFMMWLFFQQMIIFLSIRFMFDNRESWDLFVEKKILSIQQIVSEFIQSHNSEPQKERLSMMLPAAKEVYNLQYNWSNDINIILSDAKRNRNDYLLLVPNELFNLLVNENFEAKNLYLEAHMINHFQIREDNKNLFMQFEINKDIDLKEVEQVLKPYMDTISECEEGNIINLKIGFAM